MSASSYFTNAESKDSLSHYLGSISKYPLLSEEKERTLANKVVTENCSQSLNELMLPHLRYVAYIAKNFVGYGMSTLDIIQAGNVGLIKAIKKFNPARGIRLVSFAIHWIKSEINEYIIKNWSMVKVATTKEQRKLFFNLRKHKNDSGWVSEEQAKDIAKNLKVRVRDVFVMDGRLSNKDKQLESHNYDEEFHCPYTEDNYFREHRDDFADNHEEENWSNHLSSELKIAIQKLDERSKDIIFHRWLTNEKATLSELADKHQLSAERIRQIEVATLAKLKNLMGHIPMANAA
ncbi:RNA polymerase factor sigma-32 [Vibrio mediterranei]|nr:RNA polymerase factor sigma-32 [Vibrio mediterranei]